ncbi:MAG: hypothetical protein GF350_05290 [Chitinivibrionales bacterium]|nr:hypothetical protein [Chitinivibrionales bacterium]
MREKPEGLPREFGELSPIWIDMQIGQHIYHAMKSGAIEKEYALSVIRKWNIDTTEVTAEYVDQEISCAIGTSVSGDIVCILDTDNDEYLGDEKPVIIARELVDSLKALYPEGTVMVDDLPRREVFFEYYTGETVKIARQFICINPSFMYGHDRTPVCKDQFVVNLSTYEFRTATVDIGRSSYTFVCSNGFKPGMYSSMNARIMVDTAGLDSFTTAKEGNRVFGIGDTVDLDSHTFLLESISPDGSIITLTKYMNRQQG